MMRKFGGFGSLINGSGAGGRPKAAGGGAVLGMRRAPLVFIILNAMVFAAVIAAFVMLRAEPATAAPGDGGYVALLGIDTEDSGPGGHGPIATWQTFVNNLLAKPTNGGSGILVVGGGKNASDDATLFWNAIDNGTSGSVTYVNGTNKSGPNNDINDVSFAGYKMIAVVTDTNQLDNDTDGVDDNGGGGLLQSEHDAFINRREDVATFVNNGGALLGFNSGLNNPFGYIEGVGSVSINNVANYNNITATAEGGRLGLNNTLDVEAWHQTFNSYPSYLRILARGGTSASSGPIAAIGGRGS